MNRKIAMVGVTLSAMLAVSACAKKDNVGDTSFAGGTAGTTAGVGAATMPSAADSARLDSLRRDSLAKAGAKGKTP
jgi:hypothetical protein